MEVVVDVTNLGGRCFTDFNEACQFICKTKMLSTFFFKLNDKHVMVLSASKQINSQLKPTHTPQEIIAMAEQLNTKRKVRAEVYEDEPQGHPHAELMMAYAEDAKTHAEPWKLWQVSGVKGHWDVLLTNPKWDFDMEYRRKPKTHLVHGVEVPDLRIKPKRGESYYYPYSEGVSLVSRTTFVLESRGDAHRLQHNLCYEDTEAGKQAAILHSKAMLGIAGE